MPSDLIRWGGLAAMLSGLVFVVSGVLGLVASGTLLPDAVFAFAFIPMLVGLAGFHALQRDDYGRIGRAGFYTVVVATVIRILGAVALLSGSAALGWLTANQGIYETVSLVIMVGFVLYGAATLQARLLPRWVGIGFIIGLPITIPLGHVWGAMVFGIFWLALGYVLVQRGTAPHLSRVS